jgi:hypothetical protein
MVLGFVLYTLVALLYILPNDCLGRSLALFCSQQGHGSEGDQIIAVERYCRFARSEAIDGYIPEKESTTGEDACGVVSLANLNKTFH